MLTFLYVSGAFEYNKVCVRYVQKSGWQVIDRCEILECVRYYLRVIVS